MWSFWWDGFWTLKRPGKFLRTTAHAHHLDRGPNSVFCPEFLRFKCWNSFARLPGGRNRCDRPVWTGLKQILKSLVNACKARKQVSVCLPCISVEIRVHDFRIRETIFANIQAWVNTVVLTPVSCSEGVCRHGKSIFGAGVNWLLIVYKLPISRMFEITPREL